MIQTIKYHYKSRRKQLDRIVLYSSLLCSGTVLFHLGYLKDPHSSFFLENFIRWSFYCLFAISAIRTVLSISVERKVALAHYSGLVMFGYLILITIASTTHQLLASTPPWLAYLHRPEWLYLGLFLLTLAEISRSSLILDTLYFNPTLLFVIAFLTLTLLGTLLLMLPNSVQDEAPLHFIDALFMATSAVCITGLAVVDVASTFSPFGQIVILVLIQLGGLGIMTFTGFFGYFFSGGFSFKNQLLFGEIIGQEKVGAVIRTLLKIILVTLGVEAIGVVLLYFSVPSSEFASQGEHLFFALFHAVSAFCNAGFSTVENGFANSNLRFNYNMQLILTFLFIAGGIGFTILFNGFTSLRIALSNFVKKLRNGSPAVHRPWTFSFNARLMAYSTLLLVILSSALTLLLERDNTLIEHESWGGKLVAAIFMGNSARTSGFAIVETADFSLPMILITLILMWIGASPGSTGGGVKNTTVSVALLNILNLARGREQLEIFHRRVSPESINKAFAIIVLSIICIGTCLCLLAITDGDKDLAALAVEAVSAYSTCGLSLGITPNLSDAGKVIVSCTMFIGRVGMLTILVAMIKDMKVKSYSYPEEKVLF